MIKILTVFTDEKGKRTEFMSPAVYDAAQGIASSIISLLMSAGTETEVPASIDVRMYKADVEETEQKVAGQTLVKLFQAKIEVFGKKFGNVPRVDETEGPYEDQDMESMVKLG